MLNFFRKYWLAILGAIALWLLFECIVSWAAFCDHGTNNSAYNQGDEKYSCIFRGPLVSIGLAFRGWWRNVFEKSDAYIALFTALLFLSTVALWLSTRALWTASEKQFVALNRPEITIHAVEVQHIVDGEKPDKPNRLGASLLCFNKGRTTAENIEVRADIVKMRNLGVDIQRKLIKTFPVVESGQKMRTEIASDWTFNDLPHSVSLRRDVIGWNLKPSMYCIGTISYFDLNKSRREIGFCYILTIDHLGERWESAKSPEHEYAY